MNFKFYLFAAFLFFSCDSTDLSTEINYPKLELSPFSPRRMELRTVNDSYIQKTTSTTLSLRLAWNELENTSSYSTVNIYRIFNNGSRIKIGDTDNLSNRSILVTVQISDSANLNYDEQLNFNLSISAKNGEESSFANSTGTSVFLSLGEPDKISVNFTQDSLSSFNLFWDKGLNGGEYSVFNVASTRNHMLDSISINIEKENFLGKMEKILSVFGSSADIGVESGFSLENREFVIETNRLKEQVMNNKVTVIQDFDKSLFSENDISSLFENKGNYRVYFYFYKYDVENTNNFYIFKTNETEFTIQ